MSIQEPARSQLLAKPNLTATAVYAWFLYAETQPNLEDPRRYAIKRLLKDDPPPQKFLTFAQLDETTWALFDRVAHLLRTDQPVTIEIEPDLLDTFVSWADIYGGLDLDASIVTAVLYRGEVVVSEETGAGWQEPADGPVEIDKPGVLWKRVLGQLQFQMTAATFDTWVKDTRLIARDGNSFTVTAKTEFAKDWLENRLYTTIKRTLVNMIKRVEDQGLPDIEIVFVLDSTQRSVGSGYQSDTTGISDPGGQIPLL